MARYIDADKLKKLRDDVISGKLYVKTESDLIDRCPTADVVEVVRCRDCVHSRPIDNTKSPEKYFKDDCIVCECENVVGDIPTVYVPYHFCSYGEKKGGESDA